MIDTSAKLNRYLHGLLDQMLPVLNCFALHSEIRLDGKHLRFPHTKTGADLEPGQWLRGRVGEGNIHEPALVAWLFALAKVMKDRPVQFYDIGAAYGYFTALGHAVLRPIATHAVEPNLALASYLETVSLANRLKNVSIHKKLLSDRRGPAQMARRNFVYREASQVNAANSVEVEQIFLSDLLDPSSQAVDILKIDTEGWQARFLPPASQLLIERNATILLECDAPDRLAPFGLSNRQIAEPFAEAGYSLWWCDHRKRDFQIQDLEGLTAEHEQNSLLAMLPPQFAAEAKKLSIEHAT